MKLIGYKYFEFVIISTFWILLKAITVSSPTAQPFFSFGTNLNYTAKAYSSSTLEPFTETEHRRQSVEAAKGIIENLLIKLIPSSASSHVGVSTKSPTEKSSTSKSNAEISNTEVSFHDGETIATITRDSMGNITKCRLFEIKRMEDSDRILAEFARKGLPPTKINFRTMLTLITACQDIDPMRTRTNPRKNVTPYPNYRNTQLVRNNWSNSPDPFNVRTMISGILPGTKWCGLGDIAQDYEDLGMEKSLDKCCRAHDHCPTKLRSFRSGYGLINWSLYTKSHCDCDSLLYDCLKSSKASQAELLGNFYFNVLQVQCIDEETQVKCLSRENNGRTCQAWGPDPTAPKKMVFRNVRRQF